MILTFSHFLSPFYSNSSWALIFVSGLLPTRMMFPLILCVSFSFPSSFTERSVVWRISGFIKSSLSVCVLVSICSSYFLYIPVPVQLSRSLRFIKYALKLRQHVCNLARHLNSYTPFIWSLCIRLVKIYLSQSYDNAMLH